MFHLICNQLARHGISQATSGNYTSTMSTNFGKGAMSRCVVNFKGTLCRKSSYMTFLGAVSS